MPNHTTFNWEIKSFYSRNNPNQTHDMTQSHTKLLTSKKHKLQQHEEPRSEKRMLNDSKSSPTQSTGDMELDIPSTYIRKILPPSTGHQPQRLPHNHLTNRLTQYHHTSIQTDIWTLTSTQTCNEINFRYAHRTGKTFRMDDGTQKNKSKKKRERWDEKKTVKVVIQLITL